MILKTLNVLSNHPDGTPRNWLKHLTELKLQVCPRPFDMALWSRRDLVGAEVGVLHGDHAAAMLRNLSISKIYLVDRYMPYADYDWVAMQEAKHKAVTRFSWDARVRFVFLESAMAAASLIDLDFVYIDAAHDYESVKSDIAAWWTKIKPGGILGGHDFSNAREPRHNGVVQAVSEFSVSSGLQLYVGLPDWWVVKP